MWWIPATIILFYFLALLQNSFFVYFSFFGAAPNFILILFFVLTFFSKKEFYLKAVFFGASAGFFLDITSANRVGISIVLLVIIGLLIKRIQFLLKDNDSKNLFWHFSLLFIAAFILYYIGLQIYFYIISKYILVSFKILPELMYSLFFAIISYLAGKKFVRPEKNVWKI